MEGEIKIIKENIYYNSLIFGNGNAELSEKLTNAISRLIQAYRELENQLSDSKADLTSVYLNRSI